MKYIGFLNALGLLVLCQSLWAGQVYYVGKACQAGETCATTCTQATDEAIPLPTINDGIGCLVAGDTLTIQEGTYDELLIGNTFIASSILAVQPNTQLLVPGLSWDNPTTLKGAAGDRVVIQPTQNYPGGGGVITITNPQLRHVIFDNLILDANQKTTTGITISNASHIRVQNSEVKNALSNGFLLVVGDLRHAACCHEFLNVDVHHNDVPPLCDPTSKELGGHGGYIETPRTLVDGGQFHDNGHHGLQFWSSHPGVSPDDGIMRNSIVFNNSRCNTRGAGIVTGSSRRITLYNNIIYNNGLGVRIGSPDSKLYNNTVYNNNKNSNNHGIFVTASGVMVINNIVIDHRENAILDFGANTLTKSNLCDVSTFGCSFVVPDTVKVFVNPQQADFSLVLGSPAIDAGVPLVEVPFDADGIRRPQGGGYDIGAFEFAPTVSMLSAPRQLRFVITP